MPIQIFKDRKPPATVVEMTQPPAIHTWQIEASDTYIVQGSDLMEAIIVVQAQLDHDDFISEIKELYRATILIVSPPKPARRKKAAQPKKKKMSAAARRAISEGMKRSYERRSAPPPTHIGEPFKDD